MNVATWLSFEYQMFGSSVPSFFLVALCFGQIKFLAVYWSLPGCTHSSQCGPERRFRNDIRAVGYFADKIRNDNAAINQQAANMAGTLSTETEKDT